MSLHVSDAIKSSPKVIGRAWTVRISTEEGTDLHDGIQTTLLPIVEAVISTLDQILPYSTNSVEIRLAIRDTTGFCGGIMRWLSTRKLILRICTCTTKPNSSTLNEDEMKARQDT